MKYKLSEWTIKDLISLYENKKLNLNPPYQRNDIWSPSAKKKLIDSIQMGYPLPAFFLHKKKGGKYDMVDGQQRTRTILGYTKEVFPDLKKEYFEETDKDYFLNKYKLVVVIIEDDIDENSMRDFYYRVNKYGTVLNRPEIIKAEYFGSRLHTLVEKLADSPEFQSLKLFTDPSLKRMNDFDFIAELLTLIKCGITEKKISVDNLYEEEDFSEKDADTLKATFGKIIKHFTRLNKIYTLRNTRYKQRNDFYTFFGFINDNLNLKNDTLDYFYKLMVLLGNDISPANEECFALQEYATNCVSQSNSKKARIARLRFLNNLLLNKHKNPLSKREKAGANDVIIDIIEFYELEDTPLCKIDEYYLVNTRMLNSQLEDPYELEL